jgi:aspartyl-tRNA(Asn)/glutamyl-tRNA(Gln) amidotransferase subunit A
MQSSGLGFLSAAALAERIRARAVTPGEAVSDCLRRIAATQTTLNAYATVCEEQAFAAAGAAEAVLAAGKALGPLHGVPFSVKDIVNTAGVRTAWGSRVMASNVPDADAVAVKRLKDAGAILLGKTTTPEFAYKLLTDSPLTGVTRNPWNPALTPGGSSGGSAVAVTAGMGPLSLATDAGASTRLPASCCGVLGLKPTLGVVPHNQAPDGFNNFIHLGLMARTVADIALMLDVVAGPHASDPHSLGVPRPEAAAALRAPLALRGRRIAWRPLLGNRLLDAQVRAQCEAALGVLREAGAVVEEIDHPFENAEAPWRVLQQSHWAARFFARLEEVKDVLEPGFVEGIRAGGAYTGQQLLQATYKRTQFFREVQSWFDRFDWIATPAMSRPPMPATHRVDQPIEIGGETAGDLRVAWAPYLKVFNLTGHPALSVPAGFTAGGLPVGLQLVGRWYADAELLRLAALLEERRPWAQRTPPAFDA